MQPDPTPYGYCQCGCGEPTALARQSQAALGHVAGQPVAFIAGHHQRLAYKPIIPRLERFSSLNDAGCWVWTACKNKAGYGRMSYRGSARSAHRVSYEVIVGPIPEGLHLDHLCRNRACINPQHLQPVTSAENTRRGLQGVLLTHCVHGHEYTPENTRRRPGERRECRTCDLARKRAAWANRKAFSS